MNDTPLNAPVIAYERRDDGIVVLTIDEPGATANTISDAFLDALGATVDRLEAERDDIAGVVLTTGKKWFIAGADLKKFSRYGPDQAAELMAELDRMKDALRRLEMLGRPVVAALRGHVLGGGLEVALACHHRIAVQDKSAEIGLPEVTLGLLPGGGGVTRVVRMLGLEKALQSVLLPGTRFNPQTAAKLGLIDDIVALDEELLPAAISWVEAHRDDPDAAVQPWDRKGYAIPGGGPYDPRVSAVLPSYMSTLRKRLKGADYPAPKAILSAAVEGSLVDLDTASRIESRYFVSLATGQTAKNMIQAFFFDQQRIRAGAMRPQGYPTRKATKVAIVGAGMMGAGIAYSCANVGLDVVLIDTDQARADRGKAYAATALQRLVDSGRRTAAQREEVLSHIQPTARHTDAAGCDLVIEAVFEDIDLKRQVFAELEDLVAPDALLATNTSTLPLRLLAPGLRRPADLVGLHFFSPVDKMQLVEIIRGDTTSDEALARAIDVVRQLRKIPVVVGDGRGFFTSRCFGMLVEEGIAMVEEGIDPMTVERAATMAGFPAAPLEMCDEVTLTLVKHLQDLDLDSAPGEGRPVRMPAGRQVLTRMLEEFGRAGRSSGAGFYDYPAGQPKVLWPGIREHFTRPDVQVPLSDLKDRFLYIVAVESARAFEDGVVDSAAAANIASIFGIGYPPLTGGTAQFVNGHVGGVAGFVSRARELALAYGSRFQPPALLIRKAEGDEPL